MRWEKIIYDHGQIFTFYKPHKIDFVHLLNNGTYIRLLSYKIQTQIKRGMVSAPPNSTIRDGNLATTEGNKLDSLIEAESINGVPSYTTGSGGQEPQYISDGEKAEIAARETKAVRNLRCLVFLALFVAAVIISVIVFMITSISQKREFEAQYEGMANLLTDTFDRIATSKLSVIGSLRVSIMAHVSDMAKTGAINGGIVPLLWPFVAFPSFQQRAASIRKLSQSVYIGLYPVVQDSERSQWESFSAISKNIWLEESLKYQERSNFTVFGASDINLQDNLTSIPITAFGDLMKIEPGPGPYLPLWQTSPLLNQLINTNMLNSPILPELNVCYKEGKVVSGNFLVGPPGNATSDNGLTQYFAGYLSTAAQRPVEYEGDPFSNIQFPIYGSFEKNDTKPVAMISAMLNWATYLKNVLPGQAKGIIAVIENPCNGSFTFTINGENVKLNGYGDLHDTKFGKYERRASFDKIKRLDDGSEYGVEFLNTYCPVSLRVYPSQEFSDLYNTNLPIAITMTVLLVFVFSVFMFLLYDRLVERRQRLVLNKALHSSAIVSSLFPTKVAAQMLEQRDSTEDSFKKSTNSMARLKTMLNNSNDGTTEIPTFLKGVPIAELFPYTTVLFADIAGFTAWSSTREPTQVFTLLQGVYQGFDSIAKRRKVFKVETIGDSYMAVTGLPEPQEQHAIIMARFAAECHQKMTEVTGQLELYLGPGTRDLCLRTGLHSGPVTGGVLVGDKARFQLFGDTVNTASRMESTGIKGKIQVSESTAALLSHAGKSHWIKPREDQVNAKGKGILLTHWLNVQSNASASRAGSEVDERHVNGDLQSVKAEIDVRSAVENSGMIDWVCELLQKQIKKIIAGRNVKTKRVSSSTVGLAHIDISSIPIDETVEAIVMPEFNCKKTISDRDTDSDSIILDANVVSQLQQLITIVSESYNNNPFHNFQHACHVTMSVSKLLMRVVSPDVNLDNVDSSQVASHLHDYTHGINSDPITQLAILFSAIIHDVDHRGVSNIQLATENPALANKYKCKSIAEQNSLDIAWNVLMSDTCSDLRTCIFATSDDIQRFRQVVVNAVMATDIMDKDMNMLRKQRWEKAFSTKNQLTVTKTENRNLQATIVIEHLMQASDVAHTMQHWHVYQKWNRNLYKEIYAAYRLGRSKSDPSEFWYEGELSFFDNYIIPLAKKLKDCNVFGVSGDEYLNYAEKNRAEWKAKGKEIVSEMSIEADRWDINIDMELSSHSF